MAETERAPVRIPTLPIPGGSGPSVQTVAEGGSHASHPNHAAPVAAAVSQPSVQGASPAPPASSVVPTILPKRCATCGNRYPADFVVCPHDATALDVDTSE